VIGKILLIDGSQVLMDITKRILERAGYSVRCAIGFAEARKLLTEFEPDGIVLENDLPDGHGIEYCRELRENSAAPIMFFSNTKEDELPALLAGATDFLKKPFDYDVMKARIGVMINNKSNAAISISKEEELPQPITPDPLTETIAASKFLKPKYLYLASAMCLLCILIGTMFNNIFRDNTEYFELGNNPIPMAWSPLPVIDTNAKPYIIEGNNIKIPVIGDFSIPADTVNIQMILFNPENNDCYLSFTIVLTDSDKTLYSSDLIAPGMCVEDLTFSIGLNKGAHNAVVKIRAYSIEEFTIFNTVDVPVIVTAN